MNTLAYLMTSFTEQHAPLLSAERVRVEFGDLLAVNDVSFALQPGSLLGLIGPNGAGKTTLLRGLAGLQPLDSGRVRIMEHVVEPGAIDALRQIGFTPDNPPVYDDLTVRQFLQFIAKGYGMDDQELQEKISFWLEQVWLTGKADQKIKALSRGMKQRIGVARTLLPNPNVILLDEPAAGLDPAGRVQFRRLLCSLRDQGKVLIVSSHILADLSEYCTHIGIMAAGSMVQFGPVGDFGATGNNDRCHYVLVLTHPIPDIMDRLAGIDQLNNVTVDREQVTFEYLSTREAAARLLAGLIERKVPVASFAPVKADLEQAYLRTGLQQVD